MELEDFVSSGGVRNYAYPTTGNIVMTYFLSILLLI